MIRFAPRIAIPALLALAGGVVSGGCGSDASALADETTALVDEAVTIVSEVNSPETAMAAQARLDALKPRAAEIQGRMDTFVRDFLQEEKARMDADEPPTKDQTAQQRQERLYARAEERLARLIGDSNQRQRDIANKMLPLTPALMMYKIALPDWPVWRLRPAPVKPEAQTGMMGS